MREIKFRAWDKTEKRMFVPDAINFKEKIIYEVTEIGTRKYPFPRIELIEYTGLEDKNKNEIYYEDIVQDNWFVNMKLIVGEFWVCQKLMDINDMNTPMEYVEIIGNIYENPNLLKEEK